MITGGHTDICPCYLLACPQACGAEVLRKDLTAHQGVCPLEPVACPFSDIGCKVKVPRQDLDKHIQSSMLQHMTDMALSHTATKTQLTALKHEHEALIKDHTALKEDHTASKENNRAKMNAMGLFLNSASTITVAHLYTLLVDTSTMEMGSTLSLALSESNIKSGHHYIILQGYKFKLKWERQQHKQKPHPLMGSSQYFLPPPPPQGTQQQQYLISLYLVTDATYPALSKDWSCGFIISLNAEPRTINHGTPGWGYIAQGPIDGESAAQGLHVGVGGAAQGFVGGGGAAQGFVGGGGAAQSYLGAAQGYFGKGHAAQIVVGGGGAAQGLVGGGGAAQSFARRGGAAQGFVRRGGVAQGFARRGGAAQGFVRRGGAAQGFACRGGVAQGLIGGDDQLLGSVTLECGGNNITAPTLDIQTISLPASQAYNNSFNPSSYR